jgi:hypothetical protein
MLNQGNDHGNDRASSTRATGATARAVQRCTDHLLAHVSGEPVAQAWHEIADEREAWDMFTRFTNAALRDFHVRVTVPTETYDLGEFSTTL